MGREGTKRKLTAILSADAAGYSRLMEDDEEATVALLTAYRQLMTEVIEKHRGRVVDSPGDNVLAEFASVVDAMRGAVEIQKALRARNSELPDDRRMEFRIGINVGDVIEDGERIYGDGVNIAARVEGLAEGGGICISGTAYDHVKNKLALEYAFLGEQRVKNIAEPVRVYRAELEVKAAAGVKFAPNPVAKRSLPLPDKPSIAVLPFVNMTGDPDQEYVGNGITEEIITRLSKIRDLFVIARNSTFTYKGRPAKVQEVSKELGVRYVLEGSVRKAADQARITAQLVDATRGHHLWAERYDRRIEDFFALLDEITDKIVVGLQVEITRGEHAHSWHSTNSFEAWSCAVKGYGLLEESSPENNTRARKFLERAIEFDPNYVFAWVTLAWTYYAEVRGAYTKSPSESIQRAVELAQKASALDDNLAEVHSLWNTLYLLQRQHEKAIAAGQRAVALGPSDALAHTLLAQTMYFAGRFEDAVVPAERAIRLSPYCPAYYFLHLGLAYRETGRFEDAIAAFERLFERSQRGEFPVDAALLGLATTYNWMGRHAEARAHVVELLRAYPAYTLEMPKRTYFFKEPAHLERVLDALREAGLK